MVRFVNAKINIGLNIVSKRPDGYHDLETIFYPVGLECGLPHQAEPFDDVMEITYDGGEVSGCRFQFVGNRIDCPPKKNLVVRAASHFLGRYNNTYNDLGKFGMFEITLDKHLPDGAGLGGGSADAAFTLDMLNETTGRQFSKKELMDLAMKLGADCPFFLENRPCFATGIGEILTPIDINLKGYSLLIVKPDVSVSTKEAFAGIKPQKPLFDLRQLPSLPVNEWKNLVVNDFELSVFTHHPELYKIKESLYDSGALYASMSGSGSAIYGIYSNHDLAVEERDNLKSTYKGVWLFGL